MAPELQALLFVRQAHAVVAVGAAVLAGGAVQQVDIGGAVGRGAGAVFGKVACPRRASAHGARLLQLRGRVKEHREPIRAFIHPSIHPSVYQ